MKYIFSLFIILVCAKVFAQTAPVMSVGGITANSIKMDWTHNGSLVDNFVVYLNGVEKGRPKASERTFAFDNLKANTSYKLKVSTLYKLNLYASAENAVSTFNSAPTNFTSSKHDFTSIKLSWEHPDAAKVNFIVGYTTNSNYTTGVKTQTVSKQKEVTVSGLSPKTQYYFYVLIAPLVGVTALSLDARISASTLDPTPKKPTITNITPTSSSAAITWSAIAGVAKYRAVVDTQNDFNSGNAIIYDNKETSHNFPNLKSGTQYYCRVLAYSDPSFPSPWSDIQGFKTLDVPPAIPTLNNPTASADGKSISIAWKTNSANSETIEIVWGETANFEKPAFKVKASEGSTKISTSIEQCKSYFFKIRAINSSGQFSDFTASQSVKTDIPAPNAVKGYNLKEATSNKLVITWDAPVASQVDSYKFLYSTNSNFSNPVEIPNSNLSATISNLSPDKEYYFKINAANCKATIASEQFKASTKPVQILKPATPTDLIASVSSDFLKIILTWKNTVTDATVTKIERKAGTGAFSEIKQFPNGTTLTYEDNQGLVSGTLYTYRVRVFKLIDSDYSAEKSITFVTPPAAPTNIKAVQDGFDAAGKPRILVSWNDVTPNFSQYEIQRSESPSSGFVKLEKNDFGNPYLDLTTICGKTYYYKMIVCASGNNCSNPSSASNAIAVQCQVPNKPAAPTDLSATISGDFAKIILTWKNAVTDATITKIERKTGTGAFSEIKQFPNGTTLTYEDNQGLASGTLYTYRVRVFKLIDSDYSAEKSITFVTPPAAPTNIKATQDGFDATGKPRILVSWNDVTPNFSQYEIQRSESPSSGFVKLEKNDFGNPYLDLTTICGKTYYYKMIVCASGNNCSNSSSASNAIAVQCPVPNKPAAPTDLTATISSDFAKIILTWKNAVTDATITKIERKTGTGAFSEIKQFPNGTTLTYEDNQGLASGTLYTYRVRVFKLIDSDYSAEKSITFVTPPAAPTNIKATQDGFDAIGKPRILVSWNDVTPNFSQYEIQRSESPSSGFVKLEKNDFGNPYLDLTTICGKTYYYKMIVCASGNNCSNASSASNAIAVQCQVPNKPAAPTDLTATVSGDFNKIIITWKNTVTDATVTKIERKIGTGAFSEIKQFPNGTTLTYEDNQGLVSGTLYTYRVRVFKLIDSDYSAEKSIYFEAPPLIPANLKAIVKSSSQINLDWENVSNESGFELERSLNGTSFTKIKDIPTDILTFSDLGLSAFTKYFYRIRAINTSGKSGYSNIVNATTQVAVDGFAAPKNLRQDISNLNINQISIKWDNAGSQEKSIEIWKSLNNSTDWILVETLEETPVTSIFKDIKVRTGNIYHYKVRGKSAQETFSPFSNIIDVVSPIVNATEPDAKLVIYPNPFSNILNLEIDNSKIESVIVLNTNGQIMFESFDIRNDYSLNLVNLSTGTYYIKVKTKTLEKTTKIIKQ